MMYISVFFMCIYENDIILEFCLMNLSSMNLSLLFYIDWISVSFSMIVTLISGSVFMFSYKYMMGDKFCNRFTLILTVFVLSMNLLLFSGSLFFMLLGWDGLGISSFALIIYYESFDSLKAGFQTLMINRIGDALLVISTFLFFINGSVNFLFNMDFIIESGLFVLLMVAAFTKSAQYPFSSWLPAAMAAPTPVSALVHSSTLVTAGVFFIIRLSWMTPISTMSSQIMLLFGSITCLLGGLAATFENDIKKIIALSTLSQLGVMVFSLGLNLPELSLFHLYMHALFKALLFITAGNMLMASYGTQDIRLIGGLGMSMPLNITLFNISNLCLIGCPFLSGFYSKHIILEKMFETNMNIIPMLMMIIGTFMTSKYVFRTLKIISWSKPNISILKFSSDLYSSVPICVLGFFSIYSGKFFVLFFCSLYHYSFIFSLGSYALTFIPFIGFLLLFSKLNPKNSFLVSTMFFLMPSVSKILCLLYTPLKEMKNLDYGWLEVKFYSHEISSKFGSIISFLSLWPQHSFEGWSFRVRFFMSFIIILMIATFNF
nr:NADH dehydrogenase subunit 5 [Runcina aurata]